MKRSFSNIPRQSTEQVFLVRAGAARNSGTRGWPEFCQNKDGGSRGLIFGWSKGLGVTLTGGEAVLTERWQTHEIWFMRNVG